MSEVIKILLVEDDEDDYFLTSDYLEQCDSPKFELTWVTNKGVKAWLSQRQQLSQRPS